MTIDPLQWFRELALGFTFSLIFVYFILAICFYYLYVKRDKENRLLLGVSFFFVFVAFSRMTYIIFDYYLTEFNPLLYQTYFNVWRIATALIIIGFGFVFFIADHNLLKGKDKYVLTIIYGVSGTITVAIPLFDISELFSTTAIIAAMLFIPVTYLYLAIKTSDELRRKSLAIFLGFIIFGIGVILLGEIVIQALLLFLPIPGDLFRYLMHAISACFKIGGSAVLLYGFS